MHTEGFLPKLAMHIQKRNGQKWHIGRNVAQHRTTLCSDGFAHERKKFCRIGKWMYICSVNQCLIQKPNT